GSLPEGLPEEYYRRLVALAAETGARTIVDAGPRELAPALSMPPWGVKCNAAEAAGLVGDAVGDAEGAVAAARWLRARGVQLAGITRGRHEAVLLVGERIWSGAPPRIEAVSPVGSGDAFLAGLVHGLAAGESPETAFAFGLAAGAANALQLGAGELDA